MKDNNLAEKVLETLTITDKLVLSGSNTNNNNNNSNTNNNKKNGKTVVQTKKE